MFNIGVKFLRSHDDGKSTALMGLVPVNLKDDLRMHMPLACLISAMNYGSF